jgi:hypothetical protein
MHALRTLFLSGLFLGFVSPALSATAAPAKDPHHVMWTSNNGKAKCSNKGSKAKAEECAAKLRSKAVANVQVMGGKCSSMK